MKHLRLNLLFLLLPSLSWALSTDSEQPIHINSNQQHMDMKTNKVTFSGDVILTQGSIRITADTLIVLRNQTSGQLSEVQAYGKTAHFSQKTDDGKNLKGQANTLIYNVKNDSLVMTKNAELHQDDSVIRGDKITYQISTQNLQATGEKGKRVSTVIQPAELGSQ